ncbi:histone-lysine N-methyltransferase PRDM7-like [Homalodisca vitripennis]|uniref:histone-lysine N-methyltransferase PRDM7-like n=1 Tax=Homalodisca vitripennis TaxID=197043 RepID=UPI001EE9D36D|nr:histone-lysine N-methyltransferase PRDM7-like [Homalodisca vitripennis]
MDNFNSVPIQEPSFPTEAEVCSYFHQEEWVVMTEFEKMSFRNIFHNYNMMKVLGLNPEKPQFMIHSSQKPSLKRKEGKSSGPVPGKKTHQEKSDTKATINDKSKYEDAGTIHTALKNKIQVPSTNHK